MRSTRLLVALGLLALAMSPFQPLVAPASAQPTEADVEPLNPETMEASEADSHLLTVFEQAFNVEVEEQALAQADATLILAHEEAVNAATPSMLPAAASNLRDLLSLLVAGLDLGELSGEGENLVLGLNPRFFDLGRLQGSGTVTLHEAEVSERLLMALPEEVREARKTSLLEGLNEFDDFELDISWAWESSAIGRDAQDYRRLTDALANKIGQQQPRDFDAALQGLIGTLDEGEEPTDEQIREAAREQVRGLIAETALFESARLLDFSELISNQPQLYADIIGRFRDEILGQDEYGVSVTYEGGFANVNGLLRECAPVRNVGNATREDRMKRVTPKCYTDFLNVHKADWSKRWKAKVEYSETQSDSIELPDDDLVLDLASAHTFRMVGGFGFDLKQAPEVGNSPPRIDFEVKYEKVSDSEVRSDNRLVGSMTFTQKLTDGTSATLGVVYANKAELLGEVDENLSAHVGLKFNLDTGMKSQAAKK